jgi:hypothetical protein
MTAKAKLGRAVQLEQVLPETLPPWQQGRLDERRVGAICNATHYLTAKEARAVQQHVLDRAPEQTLGQLKAALKRAVIQVDSDGATRPPAATAACPSAKNTTAWHPYGQCYPHPTPRRVSSGSPGSPTAAAKTTPRHGGPPRRPGGRPAQRAPHLGHPNTESDTEEDTDTDDGTDSEADAAGADSEAGTLPPSHGLTSPLSRALRYTAGVGDDVDGAPRVI